MYDDNERDMNERRAGWALEALQYFADLCGEGDVNDPEMFQQNAGDLIGNLCHAADGVNAAALRAGADPAALADVEAAAANGQWHYGEEVGLELNDATQYPSPRMCPVCGDDVTDERRWHQACADCRPAPRSAS